MDLIKRHRKELKEICQKHRLELDTEVLSQRRDNYIQKWRAECYAYLRNQWFSYQNIWKAFWRGHTAILYSIKTHCAYKHLIKNIKL